MKVAVTGASGHVGGNLIRALIQQGNQVRALVRADLRALEGLAVEQVKGDLLDRGSLDRCFDGVEVVYHLAGHITLSRKTAAEGRQVNVMGTRNVVEACLARSSVRLVHASSIHALVQRPLDQPLDETRPLAEGEGYLQYDQTKALGEREVLAGVKRGLDAVIINPTAVIGPYDFKPSAMGQVLVEIHQRQLPALVKGGFDWVDARDVATGAMAAARRGRTGERYLLAGHWASLEQLAALVEEVTDTPTRRFAVPVWLAYVGLPFVTLYCRLRGFRSWYTRETLRVIKDSNPNIRRDKAERELDYQVRPLVETVADTLRWFERAGLIHPRRQLTTDEAARPER
ncbi:MAG: NAD-dependent epimerase/dehydratase family protein [Bradymonadales bacterium]|nr:NAD-dependent epimerase/dehydratase family protein [Bradymonadales bacterium]